MENKASFFVHQQAMCESDRVGAGTRLWAYAHIMADAIIGKDCNIGEHCFIESNVVVGDRCTIKNGVALWNGIVIEDDVFIGPYAVFTNDLRPRAFLKGKWVLMKTQVGRGASIGANATLVCGISVGEFAMVGAGTVVTENVPPHTLLVGNPGKAVGKVCFCGTRLEGQFCPACKLELRKNSLAALTRRA